MKVESNGAVFRCVIDGPEQAPCVVLSHSLATDLAMWDMLVPHLLPRYRVLRYDARGHGGTPATPGDYTLEQLGGDVTGILDALGIGRAHFVGLSMGGMVGMGLALDHPSRFLSVTVCDARGEAPPQYRDAWTERSRKVREGGIEAMVEPSVSRWFTERFRQDEPATIEWMRAMMRRASPDGYCGCAGALRGLDYERRLKDVTIPMLFLVGDEDSGAPSQVMRGMHEKTPDSRFAAIPDAGHISVVEQPQAFAAALLGFLDDVEAHRAQPERDGRLKEIEMSRFPQLTRDQLNASQMEVFNSIAAGARGGVRGPFTILLHSPDLARRVEQLGVYCRFQCCIPERQRELAICIVAAHWRADYEWYAHSSLAVKQGISQDVLDAISAKKRPTLDDSVDDAVYEFSTELLRTGRVSDETFAAAVRSLGKSGTVDLTGLLGYYTLLAMTLNAFEVDVPEDVNIPWAGQGRAAG